MAPWRAALALAGLLAVQAAAQAPAPAGQPAAPASEADADLVEFLPGFGELRNDTVYAG